MRNIKKIVSSLIFFGIFGVGSASAVTFEVGLKDDNTKTCAEWGIDQGLVGVGGADIYTSDPVLLDLLYDKVKIAYDSGGWQANTALTGHAYVDKIIGIEGIGKYLPKLLIPNTAERLDVEVGLTKDGLMYYRYYSGSRHEYCNSYSQTNPDHVWDDRFQYPFLNQMNSYQLREQAQFNCEKNALSYEIRDWIYGGLDPYIQLGGFSEGFQVCLRPSQ